MPAIVLSRSPSYTRAPPPEGEKFRRSPEGVRAGPTVETHGSLYSTEWVNVVQIYLEAFGRTYYFR